MYLLSPGGTKNIQHIRVGKRNGINSRFEKRNNTIVSVNVVRTVQNT